MRPDTLDDKIAALLRGAVDLHGRGALPAGPSTLDLLDRAREGVAAGLRAIVFTDRHFSPAPLVQTLRRHEFADSPTALLSGVELNHAVGGLNPYAVEHELMLGGRLISMPTIAAANHIRQVARSRAARPPNASLTHPALEVLDSWGQPRDAVKEILDVIASHDAVLASGHLHISEIWPLFEEARRRGVSRLLVTHASFLTDIGMAEMRDLAGMGAFVEQCADRDVDCLGGQTRSATLMAFISAASVRQTILVPKLGRIGNESIHQRFAPALRSCLDLGYQPEEIRQMISDNAMRLLGLSPRGDTQA
ncbi:MULTISPECIES: DUF6282 family protein [unclassified Chelatococcus]|uniref:DUF6282 family protein n=1 Tax=unclassified Chelatococcus TaxID=2638111 RepID=UPI001BD0CF5B|nr:MULTISPECIES: DUF6282 family protein [unclassified Chelatococcus]MBS7700003.1 hypothetical protein [Chelatococcus sp. YT9]MBX3558572.1 hypothetical protein [Chelatococcus sp.]